MLLETPLVLGRDARAVLFALQDACPHRGMPLSCGHFDGAQVECSYHGWRFDAHTGQCQFIPSLTADQKLKVDRIYAGSYACEEHDDFIWVFIPEPAPAGAGFTRRARPALGSAPRADFQREVQACLPDLRPALQRRPRHHRADGSGARAVRPPGLVVAQPRFHPRKTESRSSRFLYGFRMSAHTPSSNSAPYKLLKLYADADSITTTIDFTLAQHALGNDPGREVLVLQPDHRHPDHAQPVPHRRGGRLEPFPLAPLRRRAC